MGGQLGLGHFHLIAAKCTDNVRQRSGRAGGVPSSLVLAVEDGGHVLSGHAVQVEMELARGIRALVLAYHCAAAHHAQLRLAVAHISVFQVLEMAGPDRHPTERGHMTRGSRSTYGPLDR